MNRSFVLLGAILLLAAYLAFFCLPKRLPMTDEGMTVTLADEILSGRGIYREVECYYTPLAFYFYAGWMRMVGPEILPLRSAVLFLALVTAAFAAYGARATLGPIGAWTAGFAVVLSTFPYHSYASYNLVALMFVVASAAMLLRSPETFGGLFFGGVFAAAAFLSKQNLGGLALVGGFLGVFFSEGPRRSLRFVFGAAAALGAFAAFAHREGFLSLMIDQAILGGIHFSRAGGGGAVAPPLDQVARLRDLFAHPDLRVLDEAMHSLSFVSNFFVAIALVVAVYFLRARSDPRARVAVLLAALVPLAGLGAAHNSTTWHIIFTRPVPVLGAAFLLGLAPRGVLRLLTILIAAGFLVLHLGRQVMILDEYDVEISAPRAAGIRLRAWEAEVIDAGLELLARVPPGEKVFIAAPDPLYYHLTDRRPPVRWIYLDPQLLSEKESSEIRSTLRSARADHVLYIHGRNPWYDYGRLLPSGDWAPVDTRTVSGIHVELLERRVR